MPPTKRRSSPRCQHLMLTMMSEMIPTMLLMQASRPMTDTQKMLMTKSGRTLVKRSSLEHTNRTRSPLIEMLAQGGVKPETN